MLSRCARRGWWAGHFPFILLPSRNAGSAEKPKNGALAWRLVRPHAGWPPEEAASFTAGPREAHRLKKAKSKPLLVLHRYSVILFLNSGTPRRPLLENPTSHVCASKGSNQVLYSGILLTYCHNTRCLPCRPRSGDWCLWTMGWDLRRDRKSVV